MAQGVGFSIDTKFLNLLKEADDGMQKIIDKSNELGRVAYNAFSQITKSGVVNYVKKLEQELTTLNSISQSIGADSGMQSLKKDIDAVIKTNNALVESLKGTSQYTMSIFSQSAVNAGQSLVDLFKQMKIANDAYLNSLESRFKAEQQYQQRQQSIKSAREQETKDELRRYQQILDKIRELEKVQNDASKIRKQTLGANDKQGINAWFTSRNAEEEALTQLKYYREEAAKIEQKHEAETLLIKQQNTIKEFNDKRAEFNKYLNDVQKRTMDFINSATSAGQGLAAIFDQINKAQANLALKNFFDNSANRQAMSEKAAAQIQATEQNRLVRQNAQEAAKAFSDRMKVWEEGFRRAEEKEKQLATNAAKSAQDFAKQMVNIFDQINKAQTVFESKRRQDIFNRMQRYGDTSGQATAAYNRLFSGNGNMSLNNMQSVLSKLQDAQRKLNLDTDSGKKKYEQLAAMIRRVQQRINEATGASERLNGSHRNLINTGDQLMRKFALIFSVSQIQGYIDKLVQVRGEFELQQRAFQAILQNKAEANKIWQQTVDLAVRSPFRVGELVKYTKQLAAYRIETDNLHDTTKRLADVSAGLGVDMNRLILAYGQVRAAEYLRGTELRQFTEAGIPMLEELAKHFTELEGRAISTADVFGMISKRMVAFEDVAAVFQKMTDAGGVFYNMQEIQAETLKGQISNLHDSIDLMLNDIGKANEGTLKGGVQVVKAFVDNWQEVAVQLKDAVFAFAAVKTSLFLFRQGMGLTKLSILGFDLGIKESTISMAKWQASLKFSELRAMGFNRTMSVLQMGLAKAKVAALGLSQAFLTMLPVAIIAGIYELYMAMTAAGRAADELHESMNRIDADLSKDLEKDIATYGELTAKIKDATASYSEREKAMQALKRTFGEILPDQYLEIQNIQNVADNYDKATTALKLYYETKSRELKLNATNESFATELKTDIDELTKSFSSANLRGANKTILQKFGLDETHIKSVLNRLVDDIKKGNVEVGKLEEEFVARINKMFGVDIDMSKLELTLGSMNYLNEDFSDLVKTLQRYRNEVDAITGMSYDTIVNEEHSKEVEKQRKLYEKQTDILSKLREAYSNLYRQTSINRKKGDAITEDDIKRLNGYKEDVYSLYKILGLPLPNNSYMTQITDNAWSLEKEINQVITKVNTDFIGGLQKGIKEGNTQLGQFAETIQAKTDNLKLNDIQKFTKEVFSEVAQQYEIPIATFDKLKADSKDSLDEVSTNLKNELKRMTELRDKYDRSKKEHRDAGLSENELSDRLFKGFGITAEQRASLDNTIKAYEEAYARLGNAEDKAAKKTKKAEAQILKNRISLIEKIYKDYREALKKKTKEDATQHIITAYEDTFKEAFEGTNINLSSIVIDKDKLSQVKEEATTAGQVFSETMLKAMEDVMSNNTYIRDFDAEFVDRLKKYEAFIETATDVEKKGKGLTIGYGEYGEYKDTGKRIQKGDTITEAEATKRLTDVILPKFKKQINEILDANKDLVFTQEQYNVLLDLAYQGGSGAVTHLIELSKNETEALTHIESIRTKYAKAYGKDEAETKFGEAFMAKFKEAKNVYEKMALLLQTMNLTVEGIVRKDLSGMVRRSNERAALFSGDLKVVELLQKAAINIAEIDFTNIEGVINLLKSLKGIAEKEGQEASLALSKAISGWEAKLNLQILGIEDKNFLDSIQDMFGNYEMTLELEKLNIPPDLAKQLFGVESVDLSKIRKEIEDKISKVRGSNIDGKDELVEQLEKDLKKVEELERKAQEDRLKKYVKYLQKAQSEAVRIKINELNQLDEIEKTFQLTEKVATSKEIGMTKEEWAKYRNLVESGGEINKVTLERIGLQGDLVKKVLEYNQAMKVSVGLAKKGVRKETEDKLNENQWKLFKESSRYKLAFSDIESQSTATLNIIEDGIKSIENSLSKLDVTQMKELADLKQKVFDIKVSRNPFKALETSLKDIQDLKNKGLTKDTLLNQIVGSEEQIAEAQHKIDLIDIALNKGLRGASVVNAEDLEYYYVLLSKSSKQLHDLRTKQEGSITKNKKAKATAEQNLDTYAKADQAAKEAFAQAQQATEMMQKAYGDLSNILSAVGVEMEDSDDAIQNIGFGLLDLGMQIAQIAIQANIMGVAFQTAMGPIGWISMALSVVSTVLTGIFAAHDNSLERDIQNTIEYVEKLERAYQRLEKRIESAYSAGWINSNYADASKNIQSQINSYESMIAFEDEKKNTDQDKIREWKNEIEDLTEQLSELEQQRIEALGGFGSEANYKSAAEEFASAWFDAYREVGDGISGLEDTFDEFINNVVKKQLLIRGSQQLLQPLLEMIDNAVNDGMVTTTEMAGINKEWNDKTKDALNEYYKAIYDMYDGMIAGAGELSDLQRGIQNITEPQAAAIEAYLNSVRAFVSDSNATLKNIYNAINVSTSTPIMGELRQQTELIRSINENIGSVIGRGRNGIEGAYIKVLAH